MAFARLRDRLPSAAAAIAVQAGMAALLVLSFTVVRHIAEEKETFFILPPPARPQVARAPMMIDGRDRPPPAAAAPPSEALPAYARPGFQFSTPQGAAALPELAREIARCRIENYAKLNPAERAACSAPDMAQRDPNALPPDKPVKNEQIWQAEVARRNAPFTLPGGNALASTLLLLFNPSVFGDKRAYSAPGPELPPMDGAEMARQHGLLSDHCLPLDDTSKRNCERDSAAEYRATIATFGAPAPDHPHVSDAAFSQALAAVQARKQSLYARPVLASGTGKGGGDEKNNSSGGAGAAAGGAGTSR